MDVTDRAVRGRRSTDFYFSSYSIILDKHFITRTEIREERQTGKLVKKMRDDGIKEEVITIIQGDTTETTKMDRVFIHTMKDLMTDMKYG